METRQISIRIGSDVLNQIEGLNRPKAEVVKDALTLFFSNQDTLKEYEKKILELGQEVESLKASVTSGDASKMDEMVAVNESLNNGIKKLKEELEEKENKFVIKNNEIASLTQETSDLRKKLREEAEKNSKEGVGKIEQKHRKELSDIGDARARERGEHEQKMDELRRENSRLRESARPQLEQQPGFWQRSKKRAKTARHHFFQTFEWGELFKIRGGHLQHVRSQYHNRYQAILFALYMAMVGYDTCRKASPETLHLAYTRLKASAICLVNPDSKSHIELWYGEKKYADTPRRLRDHPYLKKKTERLLWIAAGEALRNSWWWFILFLVIGKKSDWAATQERRRRRDARKPPFRP